MGTAVIFFDLYFACCVIITDGVKVMSPGMCMNEVKMGSFQFNIFRVRIPRQRTHGNACCTRLFAVQLLKGRWFMLSTGLSSARWWRARAYRGLSARARTHALSLHGSRPRPLATGSRPRRRRGGGAEEAAAIAIPADEDSCKGPPSGARGAPDVETKGLYSTHDLAPHQADTASFFG